MSTPPASARAQSKRNWGAVVFYAYLLAFLVVVIVGCTIGALGHDHIGLLIIGYGLIPGAAWVVVGLFWLLIVALVDAIRGES